MKGVCSKRTEEAQKKYWTEREAAGKKHNRPWNRWFSSLRRGEPEVEQVQCATQ